MTFNAGLCRMCLLELFAYYYKDIHYRMVWGTVLQYRLTHVLPGSDYVLNIEPIESESIPHHPLVRDKLAS